MPLVSALQVPLAVGSAVICMLLYCANVIEAKINKKIKDNRSFLNRFELNLKKEGHKFARPIKAKQRNDAKEIICSLINFMNLIVVIKLDSISSA